MSYSIKAIQFNGPDSQSYTGAVVKNGNVVASTRKAYATEGIALREAGKLRARMRPQKRKAAPKPVLSPLAQKLKDQGTVYLKASRAVDRLEKSDIGDKKVLDFAVELAKLDIA